MWTSCPPAWGLFSAINALAGDSGRPCPGRQVGMKLRRQERRQGPYIDGLAAGHPPRRSRAGHSLVFDAPQGWAGGLDQAQISPGPMYFVLKCNIKPQGGASCSSVLLTGPRGGGRLSWCHPTLERRRLTCGQKFGRFVRQLRPGKTNVRFIAYFGHIEAVCCAGARRVHASKRFECAGRRHRPSCDGALRALYAPLAQAAAKSSIIIWRLRLRLTQAQRRPRRPPRARFGPPACCRSAPVAGHRCM